MEDLKLSIKEVEQKIKSACLRSGRQREDVAVLLATKTVSPEKIIEALKYGEFKVGENKVQEFLTKYDSLITSTNQLDFIGHLQTNKVKDIVGKITCLHSVDRWSLVEELDRRLKTNESQLDVFIQVNTSGEPSKYGLNPKAVISFLERVLTIKSLKVSGFMTIAALGSNKEVSRSCFKTLAQIRLEAERYFRVPFQHLSMGMSSDYEIAIEEGATVIRIGTAIFGERYNSDFHYWPP